MSSTEPSTYSNPWWTNLEAGKSFPMEVVVVVGSLMSDNGGGVYMKKAVNEKYL